MRVACFDPQQAMKWSAAAKQLASRPVIGAVLAGIGNLRFKVAQTLPRPPEEHVQITDLIYEYRKMGLSRRAYAALRGVQMRAVRKASALRRITAEAANGCDPCCPAEIRLRYLASLMSCAAAQAAIS